MKIKRIINGTLSSGFLIWGAKEQQIRPPPAIA